MEEVENLAFVVSLFRCFNFTVASVVDCGLLLCLLTFISYYRKETLRIKGKLKSAETLRKYILLFQSLCLCGHYSFSIVGFHVERGICESGKVFRQVFAPFSFSWYYYSSV